MNKHLVWTPGLICIAVTLAFCLCFYYRAPYHDQWELVRHYQHLQDGAFEWTDVFALHGSHWHAAGLVVSLFLAKFTHMAHWTQSLASLGFAVLGFLALARIISRALGKFHVTSFVPTIWIFGLASFFFFSLDQAGNWLWGWQVSVFINLAGVLWSIERLSCGQTNIVNTILAAIATAVAIYAFATGWALIPIGFGLLIINGAHRAWPGRGALAIWLLASALLVFHYVSTVSAMPAEAFASGEPLRLDLGAWLGRLHFSVNFVASPVVRFARDISIPITLLGIGILVWSVRSLYQSARTDVLPRLAPVLALAAYSGGAAWLTALGRWQVYGVNQAFVSRYISFGNLFWIAVFALAILAMAKRREQTHRVLIGLLSLLFILKLGNIPSVVQKTLRISADIQATKETLIARYPDITPADYAALHAPGQDITPYLAALYDHRASLFAALPEDADTDSRTDILSERGRDLE